MTAAWRARVAGASRGLFARCGREQRGNVQLKPLPALDDGLDPAHSPGRAGGSSFAAQVVGQPGIRELHLAPN